MTAVNEDGPPAILAEALGLMERALGLLDDAEAPAQIGAHLDMAICALRANARSGEEINEQYRLAGSPFSQDICAWPLSPAL